MNMENYDKDIWMFHRRIFHRYIKYFKYFKAATEALPEYQRLVEEETEEAKQDEEEKDDEAPAVTTSNIISLLTSSSDEVSPDEDNGDESEDIWAAFGRSRLVSVRI